MATEGTAVQYLAVKLVEAPSMALVTEVSPLVEALTSTGFALKGL